MHFLNSRSDKSFRESHIESWKKSMLLFMDIQTVLKVSLDWREKGKSQRFLAAKMKKRTLSLCQLSTALRLQGSSIMKNIIRNPYKCELHEELQKHWSH